GGAPGQGGERGGGAAVVGQRAEWRMDVEPVGGGEAAAAARVADQVVARSAQAAVEVRGAGGFRRIAGDDGVAAVERAGVVDAAAAAKNGVVPGRCGIAGDGGVGERPRAVVGG